jgi:hypothetical protein
MSQYFDHLFKELLTIAYKDESYNIENNLFTACFVTINTLIEYSSHDKQEKLEELIVIFLGLMESSLINNNQDVNKKRDQQCSIALSIHFAINKLARTINLELASKVYLTIVETFKQRQGVYDEAFFVITDLALSK